MSSANCPRGLEKMPFVKVTFLGHFKRLWSKEASLCLPQPRLEQRPPPPEAADLGTHRGQVAKLNLRNSVCINLAPKKTGSFCKTGLNLKAGRKRRCPSSAKHLSSSPRGNKKGKQPQLRQTSSQDASDSSKTQKLIHEGGSDPACTSLSIPGHSPCS